MEARGSRGWQPPTAPLGTTATGARRMQSAELCQGAVRCARRCGGALTCVFSSPRQRSGAGRIHTPGRETACCATALL
ncbi:hypothetical protein NN561_001025 [Cricetulus griseus]